MGQRSCRERAEYTRLGRLDNLAAPASHPYPASSGTGNSGQEGKIVWAAEREASPQQAIVTGSLQGQGASSNTQFQALHLPPVSQESRGDGLTDY